MKKPCLNPASILVALTLVLVLGCSTSATSVPPDTEAPPTTPTPTPETATRSEVIRSLTAQVILPGYKAAADSMALLSESVDALCASPSNAGMEKAREAWRNARQAWLRTESYRFGPAMDRRSISLVDWWPIDTEKIDRNLAGEEGVTAERVTEFLSSTQRGFSTAEYLLFGTGSADLSDGSDTQRCAYLQSVSAVNSEEVKGIVDDWMGTEGSNAYAGYFDGTGSLALVDSDAEAEVVRSLVFQVRTIANMRLGAALGVDQQVDSSAIPTAVRTTAARTF